MFHRYYPAFVPPRLLPKGLRGSAWDLLYFESTLKAPVPVPGRLLCVHPRNDFFPTPLCIPGDLFLDLRHCSPSPPFQSFCRSFRIPTSPLIQSSPDPEGPHHSPLGAHPEVVTTRVTKLFAIPPLPPHLGTNRKASPSTVSVRFFV